MRVAVLFAVITIASFVLNVVSGLRYTRVSADILFDMRLEMYRHLQRLSPRFYAAPGMGDIMSRINNDIGEIQRDRRRDRAGLGRQRACSSSARPCMLAWLDWRLFLLTDGDRAASACGRCRATGGGSKEKSPCCAQRSADIGSFLIETLQGVRLVVTSNAQEREADAVRARRTARSSTR